MENLFTLSPMAIALSPLVVGLVAVLKEMGFPPKFAPLLSVILAICLVGITGVRVQEAVVQGILIGLMASGLWSGSKAMFGSAPEERALGG